LALATFSQPVTAQSSTPTSTPPDNPFDAPLTLSIQLLSQIDSLQASIPPLLSLIDNLRQTSDAQEQQIQSLSQAITDSLDKSTTLQALLDQSEQTRAMQEQQLKASAISLSDSDTALQKAAVDAKALELQASWLKVGCVTFGVSATALAFYEGGRALKWW
jgi:septal ring factor EnvC (AmiA/AmiB activator)